MLVLLEILIDVLIVYSWRGSVICDENIDFIWKNSTRMSEKTIVKSLAGLHIKFAL